MNLLVVEDDPDQLTIRALLFQQIGFSVIEASCSVSAMAAVRNCRVACAVIDLCLPTEAEGRRLIRDLRQMDASLLIYVLTGRTRLRASLGSGLPEADAVFEKGTTLAPLLNQLKSLLPGRHDV